MTGALPEPKRRPAGFFDINYPDPFLCRCVSGSVPTGGSAQWSTPATTTGTANADATLTFHNYQPAQDGFIDGKKEDGVVEFGITVGIKSSAATPDAKLKLVARNKDGTWVQICDNAIYASAFGLTTSELEKTFAGYFPTVYNFNSVPFDLGIIFQSDSATNKAIARVKNSSYVRGFIGRNY